MAIRFITWWLPLKFLFHLSEFSGLFLQRFLQICAAQLKEADFSWTIETKNKCQKCLSPNDLIYFAAVWIVCNEGSQELYGIFHCIYGFVHQSPHSKFHDLTVPTQG